MNFADMAKFFREERLFLEEKVEQQRRWMEEQLRTGPHPAVSDAQLGALQARLQTLHRSKLLEEDLLMSLEDTIADCIEALPKALASVQQTQRMVLLSEKIPGDEMLARQLARKFGTRG